MAGGTTRWFTFSSAFLRVALSIQSASSRPFLKQMYDKTQCLLLAGQNNWVILEQAWEGSLLQQECYLNRTPPESLRDEPDHLLSLWFCFLVESLVDKHHSEGKAKCIVHISYTSSPPLIRFQMKIQSFQSMWEFNQTNSYLTVVQREATSPRGPRYHGGPSEELGPPHDTSRTTPCQSFWWSGKGWKLYQVACGSPAIWGSCWECSSPPLSSTSPRSKNQVSCKEEKHLKMSRRETVFL